MVLHPVGTPRPTFIKSNEVRGVTALRSPLHPGGASRRSAALSSLRAAACGGVAIAWGTRPDRRPHAAHRPSGVLRGGQAAPLATASESVCDFKAPPRGGAGVSRRTVSDLAGATLGRYQVVRRLGSRRHGRRLQGFPAQPGSLRGDQGPSPSMVEEASSSSASSAKPKSRTLRHPNIIQVFDYDNQGDTYYMVMEFLDGPTLKAALEESTGARRRCPAGRPAHHLRRRLRPGLRPRDGVVHRDVKPANIMLDGQARDPDRIRHGQDGDRNQGHRDGDRGGNAGLHVARAGHGSAGRLPQRYLLVRGRPVPAGAGASAL